MYAYLLECKKCQNIQYVGKTETYFNLRLNNHRKDAQKADGILASRHFAMKDHIFNGDASFIIIEQIGKSPLTKETKKKLFKQRENFWIMKLEKLKSKRSQSRSKQIRGQMNALPSYATFSFLQCILTN